MQIDCGVHVKNDGVSWVVIKDGNVLREQRPSFVFTTSK